MTGTIAAALIAACASIFTSLVALRSGREATDAKAAQEAYQRRQDAQAREREAVEEATATAMLAVLESLDVTMLSLQGGHLNGNVEDARRKIQRARDTYQTTRSKALARALGETRR